MKEPLFLLLCIVMPCVASAQEIEAVDSIDVETGVIYYADSTQVTDTICADSINYENPPIPQIPLEECDSLWHEMSLIITVWCIKMGNVVFTTS